MYTSVRIPVSAILVFNSYFTTISYAQDQLKGVVVIFRHGDRPPIKPYPNDPYKNQSYWPVDFGQLTNVGKMQHFELGQWLRQRYDNYLPLEYNEKDIYVRSTDVDRTLMSAEANLAGLYPPTEDQVWDEDIRWQPIPIHTIPENMDPLLAAKKPCPKYEHMYNDLLNSEYFVNISHINHDLYAYLTRYSGETISSLQSLSYFYNTLLIETKHNYTIPDWAAKVFPKKIEYWVFLSFAMSTFTPDLARLKTGPLLNEIVQYLNNRTEEKNNSPKLLMLSAHDVTIASVLNSLGAFEYHAPPFTATIIFELVKTADSNYIVRTFYKNTTEPKPITVHNCSKQCDLNDFIKVLSPITLTLAEWEYECIDISANYWINLKVIVTIGIISLLVAVLLVSFSIWYFKKRRYNKYIQLPNNGEYA